MKVAVLGAGSWGVALASLAERAGGDVVLWGRSEEAIVRMRESGQSPYFPGVTLPDISFTSDMNGALADSEIAVCALPCSTLPTMAQKIVPLLPLNALVVCGSKGLHPELGLRPSQIWENAGLPAHRFVALSGPNLAREIVAGAATSSVVASSSPQSAKKAQVSFDSATFRVYTNSDPLGVELGGALKNVVAIAAGVGDGKRFGDNAKAALMTRHWREMARLAVELGAHESTLWGLSGLGDLLATCASAQSRNHRLGTLLGQGRSLREAQETIAQTIEGVHTCRAVLQLGQERGVFLPVTQGLHAILFGGVPVEVVLSGLIGRAGRSESEDEVPQIGN